MHNFKDLNMKIIQDLKAVTFEIWDLKTSYG